MYSYLDTIDVGIRRLSVFLHFPLFNKYTYNTVYIKCINVGATLWVATSNNQSRIPRPFCT